LAFCQDGWRFALRASDGRPGTGSSRRRARRLRTRVGPASNVGRKRPTVKAIHYTGIARRGCLLLTGVAAALGTGCGAGGYSRLEPAPYPGSVDEGDVVVYVDVVPPNIEAYPHLYYAGADAYYVDGRWYRHGQRGWGYYRQEPPPLARQRPNVVQAPARPARFPPRPGVVEAQPRNTAPRDRPRRDESKEPRREHER
jgi:hypothetical protein